MSDTGAKISVASTLALPQEFYLIIHRERRAYLAKAVWRRGDEVGLSFKGAIDLMANLSDDLNYLRDVWRNDSNDTLTWK